MRKDNFRKNCEKWLYEERQLGNYEYRGDPPRGGMWVSAGRVTFFDLLTQTRYTK